ncbi:MAG: NUDIX hydrolase [Burkholderiales bacterium]
MTEPDDDRPPVVTRSRRHIAENQVFDVYFDHVSTPDGREDVPTYLVVAPKGAGPDGVTGVSVLPEMDGKLGLLRLYRHAIRKMTWEVPRGFIDPGESHEASALRELEEESGLTTAPEDLESMGVIAPEGSLIAARIHLYVAHRCRRVRPYVAAEMGHAGLQWVSLGEALALADAAGIEDPSTLLLLYRLALQATR